MPTAFSLALRDGRLHDALARAGVALRSLAESPDRAVRQAHFDHSVSGFWRQGGNLPPLIARSRGADLRIVGLTVIDTVQAAFVLPDSPIRTAADLAGRRLGIPHRVGDPLDFWRASVLRGYERILASAGLSLGDVELIEIPVQRHWIDGAAGATAADAAAPLWDAIGTWSHQREELIALATGDVDAFYSDGTLAPVPAAVLGARPITAAPAPASAASAPASVASAPASVASAPAALPANGCVPLALSCSASLIEQRPELVELVLEHVVEAAAWAAREAAAARTLVAAETGLPEQLLTLGYGADLHRQLGIELTPQALDALAGQIDFLRRNDFLAEPYELADVVAPEPLQRVTARRTAIATAAAATAAAA
ncbi:ABC transporter substrate-binding protein [Conexibacter sp. JD483]|uniref:ABC transporter substrate-binding protein n=1 Tax=unclassified Conexibacter TaxID=2627773 RepID=UPI002722F838|nr:MULTISPECIES: ABC transporter substrate-binding protein [unclassified Conexibacter]MDO8188632.1 ABC transporter substrate-binding protein [Conexibacter sp. CPCC 205706]MDO8201532.1 ABC transporter substrate-binding protein [Conexibacter sp. CPCC 205762]MDR9370751.1 ABC transporter substrate-binding protein [Conexibacter sp. JD483]